VIVIANLEWANRFAHVDAVRETCEANGKIASIEPGMGEWGLTKEDLEQSAQRTKDAVAALAGKTQCHVTTPLGTDFYVSIEGRPPLELTPYKARGQMMSPIPLWTEVAFAAIEDFTHGTAVVDGVMLGIGIDGQVKEPIRWTLEGGKCVNIEGGAEAEKLRKAIEGVENATVVGEFAFGTSEKAPFGTPSEKGRIGTVHLALGDNHNAYPGGQNHCSLHLDGVFLNATLQIVDDGTYIVKDGEWAL
jgi:leucyl aminopeptidase (aminopeptidase T)